MNHIRGLFDIQTQRIREPVNRHKNKPLVQFINQFPDYEADKAAHKNNTVVMAGKAKAVGYYRFFLISVYVIVLSGIALRIFPFTAIITFVTLPANALTIATHLSFGILFVVAYLWGKK